MLTTRWISRPTTVCAVACALLASAMTGAAAAAPSDPQAAALVQERYYESYGEPQPIAASRAAAMAQERYYASFGEPEPLSVPQSPASSSGDTPWVPIALFVGAALTIVAASATQLRRLRVRRRLATARR